MRGSTTLRQRPNAFIGLVSAAIALLLLAPSCAAKKAPIKVGILCNLEFFQTTFDGFRDRLAELGFRENRDIVYDYRFSGTDMAKAGEVLNDFARARVDLIFAFPTEAALEAKKVGAATGIDVLFANSNVEGVDLVDSIRSPGKGITGVRYPGPDITVKRLEILSQIAPEAKRYFIPHMRGIPIVPPQLEALGPVASAAGIDLQPMAFGGVAEIGNYFRGLPRTGPAPFDAVLMLAEPLMVIDDGFLPVAAYADARRIPVGGAAMRVDGHASIFGVSTDNVAVGRQAADLAAKIFRGSDPGAIPVASAEYFIEIDLGAARKAGLSIPDGLLKRADKIIK